jgi:hypothetical protein
MGHHRDVVAAQGVVGLLSGNQEKVPVGETAEAVEVDLLLFEADGAGILGVREIGRASCRERVLSCV